MQKTVYIKLTAFFLLSVFLASCSMQKRVYNRGFHVEWREWNRKMAEEDKTSPLKARKAIKVQRQNNIVIAKKTQNDERDTFYTNTPSATFNTFTLQPSAEYRSFLKPGKVVNTGEPGIRLPSFHPNKKSVGPKYYEYPSNEVSGGLGGFLTSLIALLLLFTNTILWGLLLLLIALVLCTVGIIQQIDEPDTVDLIFAVLGLCICGFAIFIFMPLISAIVLFFIANPGVLLLLLLIFGIYLLMSA